jgi:hypothetical protein
VRSVHTVTYTPADFASYIHSHIYGKTLPRFLTHVHTPITNISHPNPRTVPGDQFQPYLHLPTIYTCSLAVDNYGEYHMIKKKLGKFCLYRWRAVLQPLIRYVF